MNNKKNKIILGVFNGIDSGATLSINETILGSIQEERLTRIKQDKRYPSLSINHLLQVNKINNEDINEVTIGAWGTPNKDVIIDYFEAYKRNGFSTKTISDRLHDSLNQDQINREEIYLNCLQQFPKAKIVFQDHHYSHACSAFYSSPFISSFVITSDGKGDLQSTVIWEASRSNGLKRIKTFSELLSIGLFYSQITRYLGFTPHKHEGKITGLAAYGDKTALTEELGKMFAMENGVFSEKVDHSYKPYLRTDFAWIDSICNSYTREDIAYAAQYILEKVILRLVNYFIPEGSNIALSGGIFANVKLNQKIKEHTKINDIFIFPAMGDGGISHGSCIASMVESGYQPAYPLKNVFLGNLQLTNDKIDDNIFTQEFHSHAELVNITVDHLVDGKIIGLINEEMEYGPRALGNRSIISIATDSETNKTLNARLNRTEFMPFAPVTLMDEAKYMYKDWSNDINTNFMTICYDVTDKMKEISPACVHIDGTARPQIISEENSSQLYIDILKKYFSVTGIPNLINTSFNNHEEPIVGDITDALSSLQKNNVDYVVTTDSIISNA
ncbi:MAG: hypothetical protein CMC93_06820 [Flavobacteriaceae bacterium]|nr:hypothetical protein [Flavobacteriaceae bacterium]